MGDDSGLIQGIQDNQVADIGWYQDLYKPQNLAAIWLEIYIWFKKMRHTNRPLSHYQKIKHMN